MEGAGPADRWSSSRLCPQRVESGLLRAVAMETTSRGGVRSCDWRGRRRFTVVGGASCSRGSSNNTGTTSLPASLHPLPDLTRPSSGSGLVGPTRF